MANDLGLAERTSFIGFQPNPRDWMAASDIVAVPAVYDEGLSRVVLEALGEQACIVASEVTGIAEIYEHGVHGFLVPPGNASALTDALRQLGEDATLRDRLSRAARQLFEQQYVVERVRDQYLALYNEVLQE
jgi:glycosyltransferase involved in cell wall biosynthesis